MVVKIKDDGGVKFKLMENDVEVFSNAEKETVEDELRNREWGTK